MMKDLPPHNKIFVMKSAKEMVLTGIAKEAFRMAKKEAESVCFFLCYQPVMPQKVKDLRKRK